MLYAFYALPSGETKIITEKNSIKFTDRVNTDNISNIRETLLIDEL
jgi:hypothetical protein